MFDPNTSDLAGIPTATLKQWLLDAQTAMHDLAVGAKVVQVQYGQNQGNRMVTYKMADMGALRGYIAELKRQLGIGHGRSPITPYFTSGRGGRHDG